MLNRLILVIFLMLKSSNYLLLILAFVILIVRMFLQEVIKLFRPEYDTVETQGAVVVLALFRRDRTVDTHIGVIAARSNVGHREGEIAQIDGINLRSVADIRRRDCPLAVVVLVLTRCVGITQRDAEAVGFEFAIGIGNVGRHYDSVDTIGSGAYVWQIEHNTWVGTATDGLHLDITVV